jgi:hypothetical protein
MIEAWHTPSTAPSRTKQSPEQHPPAGFEGKTGTQPPPIGTHCKRRIFK